MLRYSKPFSIWFLIFGKFYQKLVMQLNFGNFFQKFVMRPIPIVMVTKFWQFLPKIGHATNSNCHGDQILVIFTKNWSCDQFQLSFGPRPIPIVIMTKFW